MLYSVSIILRVYNDYCQIFLYFRFVYCNNYCAELAARCGWAGRDPGRGAPRGHGFVWQCDPSGAVRRVGGRGRAYFQGRKKLWRRPRLPDRPESCPLVWPAVTGRRAFTPDVLGAAGDIAPGVARPCGGRHVMPGRQNAECEGAGTRDQAPVQWPVTQIALWCGALRPDDSHDAGQGDRAPPLRQGWRREATARIPPAWWITSAISRDSRGCGGRACAAAPARRGDQPPSSGRWGRSRLRRSSR
ncbi:hypothetical protein EV666_10942 [Camelimonas lactis]|uniref:Uncharacterized protein n=1 Tax=Camelimonas lactis TaxID=659006 RepID=A0A4R2GRG9_9HYPH|nr:hypothetical protein EV666_10942 [Camelimonas lactis]